MGALRTINRTVTLQDIYDHADAIDVELAVACDRTGDDGIVVRLPNGGGVTIEYAHGKLAVYCWEPRDEGQDPTSTYRIDPANVGDDQE